MAANTHSNGVEKRTPAARSHFVSVALAIVLLLFLILQINMLLKASTPSSNKTENDLPIEILK